MGRVAAVGWEDLKAEKTAKSSEDALWEQWTERKWESCGVSTAAAQSADQSDETLGTQKGNPKVASLVVRWVLKLDDRKVVWKVLMWVEPMAA